MYFGHKHVEPEINQICQFPKYCMTLMYFGHKHVETGPSWSQKVTIFLKYHIPLQGWHSITVH